MKNMFLLALLLFILTGCGNNEDGYTVTLKDEKMTICGEEKYLSDYMADDELNISSLKSDFEECENELKSDKQFYKEQYVQIADNYNNLLDEIGAKDGYILTDTSK